MQNKFKNFNSTKITSQIKQTKKISQQQNKKTNQEPLLANRLVKIYDSKL